MFAVFKTGGKQYRVTEGSIIEIEKIPEKVGSTLTFEDVIMLANESEILDQQKQTKPCVLAKVVSQTRSKKVIVFKKKRRQNYRRKNGHRQFLTQIQVLEIQGIDGERNSQGFSEKSNAEESQVKDFKNAQETKTFGANHKENFKSAA